MKTSCSSSLSPPPPKKNANCEDQRCQRREEARERHHHHVSVDHVGQLVRHHAFELRRREHLEDSARRTDGRVLARFAHREGVRHRRLHDTDLGLGQVGLHAQPFDDPMQLGLLCGRDLFDPHRRERDLVGGEQLQQQQHDRHDDDQSGARARREQNADEDHVDQAQQEDRQQHPGLQAGVFAKAGTSRCHRVVIVAEADTSALKCPPGSR